MKAIVTKNCHYAFNEYDYTIDDIVDVTELEKFEDDYVIYYEKTMDWIPKKSVELINE